MREVCFTGFTRLIKIDKIFSRSMKRILLLPCVLSLIASAVAAQEAAGEPSSWKKYTVKGDEFSVSLPVLPAMNTSYELIKPEMRERWERILGAYADGVAYTIYSLDDGSPQKALKNSTERLESRIWDPATEQDVTLDG